MEEEAARRQTRTLKQRTITIYPTLKSLFFSSKIRYLNPNPYPKFNYNPHPKFTHNP